MIETIKPLTPWAALSVALWLAVYSVRRWFPRAWLWLEHLVPKLLNRFLGGSLFLLFLGCASRPPARDVCYARADANAFAAYMTRCDGYASTSECPDADAIEEAHRKAQEACP